MIIISPAKRQLAKNPEKGLDKPRALDKSQKLVNRLAAMNPLMLGEALHVSDALAQSAYAMYQELAEGFPEEAYTAIHLYQGDVYKSLDVSSLSEVSLKYLQDNLRIISPLYGLLKPLDGIWPYRLEMVTRLEGVPPLMEYWQDMPSIVEKERPPFIINLASNEYSACIQAQNGSKWIDVVFQDKVKDKYRVVSVKAKRMRGHMLRYMAQNQIKDPQDLCQFSQDGYQFYEGDSTPDRLIFRTK